MSALDDIRRRAADCRSYNFGMWNADKLAHEDVPRLLAALHAVLEWCDTNQHPNTDYPAGFSSQDYALDDAARRIRAAISDALESAA